MITCHNEEGKHASVSILYYVSRLRLTPAEIRLLAKCLHLCQYSYINFDIHQSKVCVSLNVQQPNLARTLKSLIEKGAIEKEGKEYRVAYLSEYYESSVPAEDQQELPL